MQHICEGISRTKAQTMNQIPLNNIKLYRPWIRYHSITLNYIRKCSECYVDGNAYQFWFQVCSSIMYAQFSKCAHERKGWKITTIHNSTMKVLQQGLSTDRSIYHSIPTIWPLEGPHVKTYCYSLSDILWLTEALQENVWAFSSYGHSCFISKSNERCFPFCLCKFLVRL
jgi:hypothetical protein